MSTPKSTKYEVGDVVEIQGVSNINVRHRVEITKVTHPKGEASVYTGVCLGTAELLEFTAQDVTQDGFARVDPGPRTM